MNAYGIIYEPEFEEEYKLLVMPFDVLCVLNEGPRIFASILWNQRTHLPCFWMCAVRKMDREA